ncbi:MAG: MBL fold metallo-hydrolase [Thermoplasmata archaeon]|nr:MBL fold metallo-hydrolase [Thermoplasmata archaeon]
MTELGAGRRLLDLHFRGRPGLVASYLVPQEDGVSIIESGPTTCRAPLLSALREAGVEPGEVRRLFVTHIHLDHAGGAGALVDEFPRATFYAHEAGVRHLKDPAKLVESARRAWGPAADQLWGPVAPIPEARIVALRGGERFPVQGGELEAIATPGHAKHHLAFHDGGTGGVFTGDSAGVRLAGAWRPRPAVPPPDLDIELLFASVERMRQLAPRSLFYSHFGASTDAVGDLERYRTAVESWRDAALEMARRTPDVAAVAGALRARDVADALAAGRSTPEDPGGEMISSYALAAQGLLRYFQQRGLLSG